MTITRTDLGQFNFEVQGVTHLALSCCVVSSINHGCVDLKAVVRLDNFIGQTLNQILSANP